MKIKGETQSEGEMFMREREKFRRRGNDDLSLKKRERES